MKIKIENQGFKKSNTELQVPAICTVSLEQHGQISGIWLHDHDPGAAKKRDYFMARP